MGITSGQTEVTYDGHTIGVESKSGGGIGNHHRLWIDGEAQDEKTTFFGDHLKGSLPGGDGAEERSFQVRIVQGLRTHYTLLIEGEEIDMGKEFLV